MNSFSTSPRNRYPMMTSIGMLLLFSCTPCTCSNIVDDFVSDLVIAKDVGREVNLMFYGDSIMSCLRFPMGVCNGAEKVGRQRWGKYNFFVAAVGNYNAQQTLALVQDGVTPADINTDNATTVAVLLIGHNDIVGGAQQTAESIHAIVDALLASDDAMQVVSLALTPSVSSDMLLENTQVYAASRALAGLLERMAVDKGDRVHYLDCTSFFLVPQTVKAKVNATLVPDGQHLSAAGLDRLADCLQPTLDSLLGHIAAANKGLPRSILNRKTLAPGLVV